MRITNLTQAEFQPLTAQVCDTFISQLRGMMFRPPLSLQEGLLLVNRRESLLEASIHMLGVGCDLAVAWLDGNAQVVDVRLARKWRPAYFPSRPAKYVLEMHPGRLADFKAGDQLQLDEAQDDRTPD
ncbi:MAG: DUF192 domain-containing protein [Anaerolineales bacterium]|nr:DUF192 domain-containing protein [Anaerolineales bacterium]